MSATFKGRREDLRLVTGKGQYTADWNLPNQAYGHFLRADHAHAEIVSLDSSEALSLPGVLCVFTGEDLVKAGFKSPRPLMHFKGKDGTLLKNPHRQALAQGRVRFVGEPVALVVAETEVAAQDAAEASPSNIANCRRRSRPRTHWRPARPRCTTMCRAISPSNTSSATATPPTRPSPRPRMSYAQARRAAPFRRADGAEIGTGDLRSEDRTYDIYMPTQGMNDVRGGLRVVTGVSAGENPRARARRRRRIRRAQRGLSRIHRAVSCGESRSAGR